MQTGKEKLPDVLDVHSWHEFIKAIMNAGYLSGDLILSGNAIFYTYALYLIAKHRFNASYNENMHLTSLWFFYASLISLYTGSFESTVENHLNTIKSLKTLDEYKEFINQLLALRVRQHPICPLSGFVRDFVQSAAKNRTSYDIRSRKLALYPYFDTTPLFETHRLSIVILREYR